MTKKRGPSTTRQRLGTSRIEREPGEGDADTAQRVVCPRCGKVALSDATERTGTSDRWFTCHYCGKEWPER